MKRVGSRMVRFLTELRRRQVLRVLGFYAITVWVILQIAADTFTPLGIPDGVHTALIVALVLGFPVVTILAWIFDITPQGLIRTAPVEHEARLNEFGEAISERPRLWIDALVITVLLGMVAYLLIPDRAPSGAADGPKSIAVLPFTDMSEGGDNEYFSDGLTEALLDNLARIPELQVVARTSSFAYKGRAEDVREIGARLGAATILEGSVRRAGERIKITAQLVDVASGYHLWSQTYDRTMRDIFAVQDDIAISIAAALRIELLPTTIESLAMPVTEDIEAYDLYLRGRGQLRATPTVANVRGAIESFHQALRRDPTFTRADAGLCTAYLYLYDRERDPRLIGAALDACRSARTRDESLAEVHAALGWIYVYTGNNEYGIEAFRAAIERDPLLAEAHRGIGRAYAAVGDKALAEIHLKRAVELDPDNWRSYASLGAFALANGDTTTAEHAFLRAVSRAPEVATTYSNLGALYLNAGRWAEAVSALNKSLEIEPTDSGYGNAGTGYYYLGHFEDARRMFERAIELAPARYEYRGGLADACRHLPDARDCAEENYREAIRLVAEHRRINSRDAGAAASQALFHANLGEVAAARRAITRALELAADNPFVVRAAILVAAAIHDDDEALAQLERAVALGHGLDILMAEPDFARIRELPRFRRLLAKNGIEPAQPAGG